ncbi:MAG: 16S rRNA (guanine(966)-N(2))-methyltransferase RsmD, partial [Polyangiaceae bacterium]
MRITGGKFRSRALKAPKGQATRPTSDRVREALFGILEAAGGLRGARVLDLYAGTGALGLEALSRGASLAVLVESSRKALAVLRANVNDLGLGDRTRIIAKDAGDAVRQLARAEAFNIVFADPPWAIVDTGAAPGVLAVLAGAGVLSAEACVVLEHSARTPAPG